MKYKWKVVSGKPDHWNVRKKFKTVKEAEKFYAKLVKRSKERHGGYLTTDFRIHPLKKQKLKAMS
jgi:hypothetical protein